MCSAACRRLQNEPAAVGTVLFRAGAGCTLLPALYGRALRIPQVCAANPSEKWKYLRTLKTAFWRSLQVVLRIGCCESHCEKTNSRRPKHALGVENGFHVDAEGFHSVARFRQPGHRLDDEVQLGCRDSTRFGSEFQIVLGGLRLPSGGLCILAPQHPSQNPTKVDQGMTSANPAGVMRAAADGFTINAEHGIEEGDCAHAFLGIGCCVHIQTPDRKMLIRVRLLFLRGFV